MLSMDHVGWTDQGVTHLNTYKMTNGMLQPVDTYKGSDLQFHLQICGLQLVLERKG